VAEQTGLTGTEHQHQVTVASWALVNERRYPELALLHAIPNGGQRDVRVARKMKLEGVKPGVPDMNLPVPRGGYTGLWIEMKSGKNGVTVPQAIWRQKLVEQGHVVAVCWSADVAILILELYLEGKCNLNTLDPVGEIARWSSSHPGHRYLMSRRLSLSNDGPTTPAA
jgi:hypothetical protein